MQSTFLAETAKCLYDRYGRDISSLTIVLPSVRARLFFTDELSHLTDKPLWSPQYMSMDDIMREASSFSVGEKVRMITDLYKVYSEYHDEQHLRPEGAGGRPVVSDTRDAAYHKYLLEPFQG